MHAGRTAGRLVAAVLTAALGWAEPGVAGTLTGLPLDDPSLSDAQPLAAAVSGRVVPVAVPAGGGAASSLGFRHAWPAIVAVARFEGDRLVAAFDDDANRYRIRIDGGPEHLVDRPGRWALRFDGLGPGPHTARLEKLSEAGAGTFAGFLVPAGGAALDPPAPSARRIEFIGDSDTVGYGNTSPTRVCEGEEVFLATDTQASFGPRVARAFDADARIVARSGIGLVRNYGGGQDGTMSDLYPLALTDEAAPLAADGWAPQIVVLTLGSNDFATPLGPGEPWPDQSALRDEFQAAVTRFLAGLRARYPDAFLLVAVPREYDGGDYAVATEAAVEGLRTEGEAAIDLIPLPVLERTACHWHPSLRDHGAMAETLIAYIAARPALWQGR
jgi:lysophospholipase L1-like esterase